MAEENYVNQDKGEKISNTREIKRKPIPKEHAPRTQTELYYIFFSVVWCSGHFKENGYTETGSKKEITWCCLPPYAEFKWIVWVQQHLSLFPVIKAPVSYMEPCRKVCWILGWNLNGGCKVKWKSPSKDFEICDPVCLPLRKVSCFVL